MSKIQRSGAVLGAALWVSAISFGQQGPGAVDPTVVEAFGPYQQMLHVGAASFQHLNNVSGYEIDWTEDGYLTYTDEGFQGVFVAPLMLPSGALIESICTFFYDTAPAGTVTTYLEAVKLSNGSTAHGVVPVSGTANDIDTGYGYTCAFPDYTYGNLKDVDGDGGFEFVVHRIRVDMTEIGDGRLALGAVQVNWSRQVSPPPAGATFGDVPTDHPQFQFVEALWNSGITAGCAGGNYCPDAPLTRGQMAVFLAKGLGLHWPW